MDTPKFGNTASPILTTKQKTKPILATLGNAEGGLRYKVIDIDFETNVFELIDPHTGAAFLIHDARTVLNTLGYETKND